MLDQAVKKNIWTNNDKERKLILAPHRSSSVFDNESYPTLLLSLYILPPAMW